MSKSGPILIIEDDHDDWEIFQMAFTELGVKNKLVFFDLCEQAYDYLCTTSEAPFIIFCDVNMPRMNGLEFRRSINQRDYLRQKSIPFVFMSTSAGQGVVEEAYDLTVQGFFEKEKTMNNTKATLDLIVKYWQLCRHPNTNK